MISYIHNSFSMRRLLVVLSIIFTCACGNNPQNEAQNGSYSEYYSNGAAKVKGALRDGKPHGNFYIFDSSGRLTSTNFFYYGLRTGPAMNYKNGSITDYYFYSLENQEIYHLNYDSVGTRGLLEVNNRFFWINSATVNDSITEFRIYNICPPKYKCDYSLVIADSLQQFKKLLYHFDTNGIWHTAKINTSEELGKNEYYAIKIEVIDSINQKDCVMQKFLR
jgi:hypothetical protein